jgi:hypothetical protein
MIDLAEWGKRYSPIGQAWRRAWDHVIPFFAFAPSIRKMIYTDEIDKQFVSARAIFFWSGRPRGEVLVDRRKGSMGQHDNYGSALTAQPGKSQRRPATNSSSQLIV